MKPNPKKRIYPYLNEFRGHKFKSIQKDLSDSILGLSAQKGRPWSKAFMWVLPWFILTGTPAWPDSSSRDLTDLSLEDLLKVSVTSVSKKEEKLSDAPSAVFVITQEDIRRSGVTSIPEALRMAPGVEVARIDANKWAISARGFNSRFATKLLVLMDGRSVYSPAFSGVWWDVQDTLLEDIERIEVIRGPGATLWGANAVNGVINIITKKAGDTQGGLVTAGAGTEEKGFGSLRYGLKLGEHSDVRAYVKYFNRDSSVTTSGADASDSWDQFRTGFRVDHEPTAQNNFTLQGDYYRGKSGSIYDFVTLTPPFNQRIQQNDDTAGGNILGRWKHVFSNDSELSLQTYYDRTEREDLLTAEKRDTVDFDLQHRFKWIWGQDIVWGLGYRFTHDDFIKTDQLRTIDPSSRTDQLFSAFIQDDITLIEDRLRWVIGSKFEHNDYTGYEVQPSTRLIWTPSKEQSIWGAVSRSVRTPSRAEQTVATNVAVIPSGQAGNSGPFPILIQIKGDSSFQSEELISYELGYRLRPINRLTFDLAGYYNKYSNLRNTGDIPNSQPTLVFNAGSPYLQSTLNLDNSLKADIYGMELALEWQPLDWWRIKGSYTFAEMHTDQDQILNGAQNLSLPRHQFSIRSSMNLGKNIEADAWLRYVDGFDNGGVPSYFTLDLKLAWRPVKNLELALVGQNLLENRHQEFRPEQFSTQVYEMQRGFYGKLTWRF
jgi:iron complex outermembrane recepter protein